MSEQNTKTPTMVLQEFTMKHYHSLPQYLLVMSITGTHETEFYYKVSVADVSALGYGRSKQVAKHNAASRALDQLAELGLYNPGSKPAAQNHGNDPLKPPDNFIGTLNEWCCKNKLTTPIFNEMPSHCREFNYECKIDSITTRATAHTKKQAKQLAARKMLDIIRDIRPDSPEQHPRSSDALTENAEKVHEIMKEYKECLSTFEDTINRAVSSTSHKKMQEKNITLGDFNEQLEKRDKEGVTLMEINYEIELCLLRSRDTINNNNFRMQ